MCCQKPNYNNKAVSHQTNLTDQLSAEPRFSNFQIMDYSEGDNWLIHDIKHCNNSRL